jgi:O-antigen/teichoic acid export membrane protein
MGKTTNPKKQKMKFLAGIIKSNKSLVLLDQFFFSGTNFIATLLLARVLSAQDFGIYASVVIGIFLAISLGNSIIIQPLQVAPEIFRNSTSYSNFLFAAQLVYTGLTAMVALVILLFFETLSYKMALMFFLSVGMILHDYFRKYFLAKNALSVVLKMDVLASIPQIMGLWLIDLVNNSSLNNTFIALGTPYYLALLYALYKFKPNYKDMRQWKMYLKFHFREGRWLGLVSFVQWASANLFVVSLGIFVGIEALGAFRLVQSLFGVLNVLFQTFENYVLPNASRIYANSVLQSKLYLRRVSMQSGVLIGLALLLLFIFSTELLQLAAGNKYSAYGYVVRGMCLLYFILFLGYPIRLSIRMLLLNQSFFIGYLISLLFNSFCFNFLIKSFELNGVIIGLIANQIIMLLFWNYQLHKNKFYLWK